MATVSKLAVIVAQHGADVSSCLVRQGDGPYEVVTQEAEETPSQLAHRVRDRLAHLAEAGCRVHSASFVARADFDVRDVLAAAGLVRSLVAAMVAVGAGQVHLYAQPSDLQTRYAITALADAINEQLQGTGVALHTDLHAPVVETSRRALRSAPASIR